MSKTPLTLPARLLRAGLALLSLGAVAAAALWNPETHPLGRCLFNGWTDLPCFTCGMSRAFALSGHLQFSAAFTHHPMGPVLWLFLLFTGIYSLMEAAEGHRLWLKAPKLWRLTLWYGFLLWFGFGTGRLIMRWIQSL